MYSEENEKENRKNHIPLLTRILVYSEVLNEVLLYNKPSFNGNVYVLSIVKPTDFMTQTSVRKTEVQRLYSIGFTK